MFILDGYRIQLGQFLGEVKLQLDVLLLAISKLVIEKFRVLH